MSEPIRSIQPEDRLPRRLAAIAFLDVVGYSRLMGADEEGTLREWSALRREVIAPRVAARRGRIVNSAGDGLFVEFHSALDAFRWAVDVQAVIASRGHVQVPMRMRVALHLGDVIDAPDGEVYGDGVNTAARLQTYAEPGGIVVSQAVMNEVLGKADAVFSDLGELRLKNITRPVRAYHLRVVGLASAAAGPAASPGPHVRAWWTAKRGFALAAAPTALALLLLPSLLDHRDTPAAAAAVAPAPPPTPREKAERLLREGRAIGCPAHPCPREWLAARSLYEQAIAADPNHAPPYARAAFTYTNFVASGLSLNVKEDLRAAELLATKAVALAPGEAYTYEARAAVLRQDPDRLEDALAAYLRSLAIEPKQPSVRANAGWMLVLLGRPAEAEPFLHAALAEAPDHERAPAWLTYLGLAELFLDREGHGAAHLRQALARQPQNAAAGDAALQRGLSLAAALALSDELKEAQRLVNDLRSQHPALSVRTLTLWNCRCSRELGFVAGLEKLRRGLILAGVADVR